MICILNTVIVLNHRIIGTCKCVCVSTLKTPRCTRLRCWWADVLCFSLYRNVSDNEAKKVVLLTRNSRWRKMFLCTKYSVFEETVGVLRGADFPSTGHNFHSGRPFMCSHIYIRKFRPTSFLQPSVSKCYAIMQVLQRVSVCKSPEKNKYFLTTAFKLSCKYKVLLHLYTLS